METVAKNRSFGGTQGVYTHQSPATNTEMRFSVFEPPAAAAGPVPAVIFLSGLTCTEENFTTKAGAQRAAAELGLMVIAPDTSPRGEGVPDDDAYDLGQGAGFYLNATQEPWRANFQMATYVTEDLVRTIRDNFEVAGDRFGLFGHSMGGHGALVLGLKFPELFASVSAFAPICNPVACPWGEKAFAAYLGEDRSTWVEHDACALIESGRRQSEILVDQGLSDNFLTAGQLLPEALEAACEAADQPLVVRRQAGYDHSYFFIASFVADHLAHHADAAFR